MDIFLMDLILKGKIKSNAKVLDVGCGEGRNGVYFIQAGYEYHGWDTDSSKLKLLQYLAKSLSNSKGIFRKLDLRDAAGEEKFDLVICSRVLHFAKSKDDLKAMWRKLGDLMNTGSILYMSMDSIIDNSIGKILDSGMVEFPDGKVRFALDQTLYNEMKKGFEEIEPLRTLVHHNNRAQSFICLKKL